MSEQDAQTVEDTETEETTEVVTEETPEGFISLEQHQKDVNVQHKRFRDEERGRKKQKERADKLQAEIDELRAKDKVEVPPVPDRYSDTYEDDLKRRDEAIRAKAEQDAESDRLEAERKEKEEAQAAETEAEIKRRAKQFDANTLEHGLDPADTKKAVDQLLEYDLSDNLMDALIDDPDGPLFAQYLAQNPMELEGLMNMSAYALSQHFNGEVRQRAQLLKPKVSTAPPPPETIEGGGAPETKEPWEQGAVYD
jgi:hypothetical protein